MRDVTFRSLRDAIKADKKAHALQLTDKAAKAADVNDTATLYKIVKALKPYTRRPAKAVLLKNGQLAQDPLEACKRWQEHFAEMLHATNSTFEHIVSAHNAACPDAGVPARQENLPTISCHHRNGQTEVRQSSR